MSTLWKLDLAGDRRSLRGWGLTGARIRYAAFEPDEFTAFCATPDDVATADPLFAYDSEFSIYRGSTRVFVGRVPFTPALATGSTERQGVRALGVWEDLNRVTFLQNRYHFADPDGPTQALTTPMLILFQEASPNSIIPLPLDEQVEDAIDFAITQGVDIQRGTIEPAFELPPEEAQDLSITSVIQKAYRWAPDSVPWFDYTTDPPTLHIRRRANLQAINVAITDCDNIEVQSRPDLLINGIKIYIRRIHTRSSDGAPLILFDTVTTGATTGLRRLVFTIRLDNMRDQVPADLVANYLSTINVLQWEGHAVLRELEPTIAARPGNILNLTGGHSDWTTMNAVVQETIVDIDNRATTIKFGPPVALGFADFYALMQQGRKRPPTGDTLDGTLPIIISGPPAHPKLECRRRPGTGGVIAATDSITSGNGANLSSSATATYNPAEANWDIACSATLTCPPGVGGAGGRVGTNGSCAVLGGEIIFLQLDNAGGSTGGSGTRSDVPAGNQSIQTCCNLDVSGSLDLCLPANGDWSAWVEVVDDECITECIGTLGDDPSVCNTYEAQFRVTSATGNPNGHYDVDIDILRRPLGSSDAFGLVETQSFATQADSDGNISLNGDVPNVEGYETCVRLDEIRGTLGP